ncbi:MAG: hypothetical protein B7Y41_03140 [Hydrogenophilales bacterium 28-61-23]|nr:MAG: hypothetical protein B7Y41_03140 [Hydrogenophilales bacterium 28-61-23]
MYRLSLSRPSVSRPSLRRALLIAALLFLALPALARQVVTIGVINYRPKAEIEARWQPLMDYLTANLPDKQVRMLVLSRDEMEVALHRHELDFVFTNPAHFLQLRQRNSLSGALATLVELENGQATSALGGVIFTRAEQSGIANLNDLRGKTLAHPGNGSLAGYQAQAFELVRADVHLPADVKLLPAVWPQDRVIEAVLNGKAEVGFVRSGVIEQMAHAGKLDPRRLRIINRQDLPGFPFVVSTRLYPEWPFVALPHVDETLARKVAAALLSLDPQGAVAKAGHFHGFTIPANYEPVNVLLRELRLPPYDSAPPISLSDIWARYRPWLIAAGAAGLLILALAAWVVRINRRLSQEQRKATAQAAALRESEAQFRSLVQSIPGAVYRCALDEHWTIHFISDHIETLTGYPLEDFLTNRVRSYASIIHPDDVAKVDRAVMDSVRKQSPYGIEYRILHASGEVRWVFEKGQAEFDTAGAVAWLDGVITDISDRKRTERDLNRFRYMVEHTPQEVWLVHMDGRMAYANMAAAASLGYTQAEIAHLHLGDIDPEDRERFPQRAESLKSAPQTPIEVRHLTKDGRLIPKEIRASYLDIDGNEYICGFGQDITARKEAEEQIRQLAYFDPLTDLPNRRMLMDRLRLALIASSRNQEYGALLMLDLDHFKTLNDTQGHDVGDRLLIEVAKRLLATVREQDTVSRLGGDEFVVMLEDLGADEQLAAGQAELIAEKVRAALNEPYALTGRERDYHTTSSIGLTLFHRQDTSSDGLLKQADVALYQSKDAGRNTIRFFNPAMQAAIDARMAMDTALRRGLREGELKLFYQPQRDQHGKLLGAEALLRWQPPNQIAIAPAQFIPLAEQTGLILPIGFWVMETACRQLKDWESDPRTRHLTLAVNVSPRQFLQRDFVEQVAALLEHTGANPARLKFELTESTLFEDMESAIARMEQTRALGVSFSLDDFGTGFSSLSYLKRLPLDQVKIDQSFVRDIAVDANDAAIVSAILAMSRTLGLHVIAEGVETGEQLDFLRQNGCTAFQGYLFGKPLPIEEWGVFL